MHTFGVLGSGVHRSLQYINDAMQTGELSGAQIGMVLCNRPDMPLNTAAIELNLPNRYLDRKQGLVDEQARDLFLEAKVDTVLLIGYYSKVGEALLNAYPNKILNIHSGPLPRFGGKGMIQDKTQQAVMDAGLKWSGPTIHIVDAEYDHGQILGHWPVAIRSDDTADSLNERCNQAGRQLYVSVLKDYLYRLDHPELFG